MTESWDLQQESGLAHRQARGIDHMWSRPHRADYEKDDYVLPGETYGPIG